MNHEPILTIRAEENPRLERRIRIDASSGGRRRDHPIKGHESTRDRVILLFGAFVFVFSCCFPYTELIGLRLLIATILSMVVTAVCFNHPYPALRAQQRFADGLRLITGGTFNLGSDRLTVDRTNDALVIPLRDIRQIRAQFGALVMVIETPEPMTVIALHRSAFESQPQARQFFHALVERTRRNDGAFGCTDHTPCLECGFDLKSASYQCPECGTCLPVTWPDAFGPEESTSPQPTDD